MKNKIFATLLLTGVLSSAHASYLESCLFEAEVKLVTTTYKLGSTTEREMAAIVEVKKATNQGSHLPSACARHLDDDIKIIKIEDEKDLEVFEKGKRVKLDYFHANSNSPNGVIYSTRYSLVE